MVLFPNCKINLGLNIISKRTDGYHNLETVFLPIPLCDALEITRAETSQHPIKFTSVGLPIAGEEQHNLCVKAYWLLKNDFPQLPAVNMCLLKAIPMGAGLGGGSADGAFALLALNNKFRLGIPQARLVDYALRLGSDCPFFIINKPCFAHMRGEALEEITINTTGYKLLLVNPGIHIGTGWAFSQIKPQQPQKSIRQIINQPMATWKDELVNDFEAPVIMQTPVLGQLKSSLYAMGAVYASMSGSGSSFFGIFANQTPINTSVFPAEYLVREISLKS